MPQDYRQLRAGQSSPEARPGDAPALEPLCGIDGWARVLACSRRAVERLRAAGKLPRPDVHVGRMPRWTAATVRAWIAGGGKGGA